MKGLRPMLTVLDETFAEFQPQGGWPLYARIRLVSGIRNEPHRYRDPGYRAEFLGQLLTHCAAVLCKPGNVIRFIRNPGRARYTCSKCTANIAEFSAHCTGMQITLVSK